MLRERPTPKWVGPYVVSNIMDHMLRLDTGDRVITASIDKVKVYKEHTTGIKSNDDALNEDLLHSIPEHGSNPVTNQIPGSIDAANGNNYMPTSEQIEELDRWISSVTPLPDAEVNAYSVLDIHVVKIIKDNDVRVLQDDFVEAKKTELEGLKPRGLWNIVDEVDVYDGGRIISGRFILSLKNYGTPNEKAKVRFIAQGFLDRDKSYVVHDTSTLRAASIRIILSVAAIERFRIFLHDVTQAYLQSKYELSRKIYIRPKREDLHLLE